MFVALNVLAAHSSNPLVPKRSQCLLLVCAAAAADIIASAWKAPVGSLGQGLV